LENDGEEIIGISDHGGLWQKIVFIYLIVIFLDALYGVFHNCGFKVHKHDIFFITFFAETETLWSKGPVTRDF
jgi:hypothetical protein